MGLGQGVLAIVDGAWFWVFAKNKKRAEARLEV
jgi:hypothetical protein